MRLKNWVFIVGLLFNLCFTTAGVSQETTPADEYQAYCSVDSTLIQDLKLVKEKLDFSAKRGLDTLLLGDQNPSYKSVLRLSCVSKIEPTRTNDGFFGRLLFVTKTDYEAWAAWVDKKLNN